MLTRMIEHIAVLQSISPLFLTRTSLNYSTIPQPLPKRKLEVHTKPCLDDRREEYNCLKKQ